MPESSVALDWLTSLRDEQMEKAGSSQYTLMFNPANDIRIGDQW